MGSEIAIKEPEIKDLQESGGDMLSKAALLVITDDSTFTLGGEMLLEIKRRAKAVEERFDEPVKLAHKAHKALTALRDTVLSPFKKVEQDVKQKMGAYQMDVERKRKAEEERLRRQQEAQAEADRIAKAEAQMDKGDLKGCEQTLNAPPAYVPPPAVTTPAPPKVEGVSFRDVWKFEIVDASQLPREYLVPDEKAIRKVVSGLMGKTNIPGIRVWSEKEVRGQA